MHYMRANIREFEAYVVEFNQWSKAEQYFVYLEKYENSWRPASLLVRDLMRQAANVGQAANASVFLSEFLSKNTPPWVIRRLQSEERGMYIRLRSPWGIQKCFCQFPR
jgi:hypothetical protein